MCQDMSGSLLEVVFTAEHSSCNADEYLSTKRERGTLTEHTYGTVVTAWERTTRNEDWLVELQLKFRSVVLAEVIHHTTVYLQHKEQHMMV